MLRCREGAAGLPAVLAALALLLAAPGPARAGDEPDSGDEGTEDTGESPPAGDEESGEPEPPAEGETGASGSGPASESEPGAGETETIEAVEATDEEAPPAIGSDEAAPDAETAAGPEQDSPPWLGVGLVLDFMFPSGKPASGSLGTGQTSPSGERGFAVPVLLNLKGYLSLWKMIGLSPSVEVGWFRLKGEGHQDLPNDPDFTSFDYEYHIDNLPIFAGLALMIDPLPDWPLHLAVGGGFAALYAWAQTRYDPADEPAVTSKVQSDWGLGWYVGVEASYSLWIFRISLEYRYSSARTDLELQDLYPDAPYNSDLGDLQGSHLMLGLRVDLGF